MNSTEAELSAVLNLIPYMDKGNLIGKTLEMIYNDLKDNPRLANSEKVKCLGKALETHKEWKNVQLVNTSKIDAKSVSDPYTARPSMIETDRATAKWDDDYIQGMTFVDGNGNYYVSYRGTGDGRWTDNGEGMVRTTAMQKAAALYFDQMAEQYDFAGAHGEGKHIVVTGHSKGGNEAQYVYMASRNADYIDNCYSFDGQGFSEETIREFEKRWNTTVGSEEWNRRMKNLYSICGDNDYVHPLGIEIVNPDNLYYVKTGKGGLEGGHDLAYMFNEKGILHWNKDKDIIINGEAGPMAVFAYYLSAEMMKLPPELREGAAKTFMRVIDFYFQNKNDLIKLKWNNMNLGPNISMTDLAKFFLVGDVTVFSAVLHYCFNEGHIALGLGLIAIAAIVLLNPVLLIGYETLKGILLLIVFRNDIADMIKNFINGICEGFEKAAKAIKEWFNSKTAGYQYATSNPQIVVDTGLLRTYADQLKSINTRLGNLDSRMDRLYWKVGLRDLFRLIKADLLTSKSPKLKKCISYLENTGKDFEKVENELKGL